MTPILVPDTGDHDYLAMLDRIAQPSAGNSTAAAANTSVHEIQPGSQAAPGSAAVRRARISRFSARAADVVQCSLPQWLWPRWVAAGRVTLLVGESGLGKSSVAADLAARVSRGAAWPDDEVSRDDVASLGETRLQVGTCLMMGRAEQSVSMSRRLLAAGADLERICSVEPAQDGSDGDGAALDDYLAALEEALEATPDCKLVVIDPLLALVENVDGWLSRAMRRMLRGLARLARKHGVAIVAVADLGLRASLASVERMMKSLGTGGAGMATLGIFRDPADAQQRWLISLDENFAVEQAGLKFGLANVESDAATIDWGEVGRTSLQKLIGGVRLSVAEQEYRDKEEFVTDKLREILADGPVRPSSMEIFIHRSDDRLMRAAKRLGVVKKKVGYNGGWLWMLPEHFPAWQAEQAAKKERAAAERNEQQAKKQYETRAAKPVAGSEEVQGTSRNVVEVSGLNCEPGQETFGRGQWQGRETLPLHTGILPQHVIPPSGRPDKKFARWEKRRNKKLQQQQNGELDENDEHAAGQGELPEQRSGP